MFIAQIFFRKIFRKYWFLKITAWTTKSEKILFLSDESIIHNFCLSKSSVGRTNFDIFGMREREKRILFWGKCVGATYKGLLSMRQNTILLFSRHLSRNYGIDIPPTFHFHCWIQFDITIYHYFSLHQSKFFPALFLSTYHQQVWSLKQFLCLYFFIKDPSSALIL